MAASPGKQKAQKAPDLNDAMYRPNKIHNCRLLFSRSASVVLSDAVSRLTRKGAAVFITQSQQICGRQYLLPGIKLWGKG